MQVVITKTRLITIELPSEAVLEGVAGYALTDDEVTSINNLIEKGIEAQLDWTILIQCAIAEVIK